MKYKYMHTIDGQPALFDGDQICYAGRSKHQSVTLCNSVKQIHEQRKSTCIFRKKNQMFPSFDYGWVIVRIS